MLVWLFSFYMSFRPVYRVTLGGDLLVRLFDMVVGQDLGIVGHFAGAYFELPVGISHLFRNDLSFRHGEVGKNAVVLGPAVDVYAHECLLVNVGGTGAP